MSASNVDRLEWDNLKEEERNCLLWPDFLEWGDVEIREIRRKEKTDELGIISVVVQDPKTKVCYNIIKQIKEGKPASGRVNPFEWIIGVDGKLTTSIRKSEELVKLIKNEKDQVNLGIREPVNALKCKKQWSEQVEKIKMNLGNNLEDLGFRLAHFYSKAKDEDEVVDRILIFEGNSEIQAQTIKSNKQLRRGDELIAVDGFPVKGKKLKDIYSLIKKPAEVLSIKKVLPDKLTKKAVKSPDRVYWNQQNIKMVKIVCEDSESSLGFILSSGKSSTGEIFHVISGVTENSPAFHARLAVGDRLMSVNGRSLRDLDKIDAINFVRSQDGELELELCPPEGLKESQSRRRSFSNLRRQSPNKRNSVDSTRSESMCTRENLQGSSKEEMPSQSEAESTQLEAMSNEDSSDAKEQLNPEHTDLKKHQNRKKNPRLSTVSAQNEAYCSSGQNDADLCNTCDWNIKQKQAKKLPDDKLLWPVNMIEMLSIEEIYRSLDSCTYDSDSRKLGGHLGLPPADVNMIYQRFSSQGGYGAAREMLLKWTKEKRTNNVGKLRDICGGDVFKNADVIRLINEWMEKDVCYGCGRPLDIR